MDDSDRDDATHRAFTDAYRKYLDTVRGGWPPNDVLHKWFKERCRYAGGTNTRLRRGIPVHAKYTQWFVALLVSSRDRAKLEQARRATLDFVTQFGITELTASTADAIREHICYPPVPKPGGTQRFIDYLRYPAEVLSDILYTADFDGWVRSCSDSHLARVVEWIYLRVAHETAEKGRALAENEALESAARFMGIERPAYAARVSEWKRHNPWTVLRAWHKSVPVGVNIMLPLSQRAYSEVLEGRRTPYNCGPGDLELPSLNLVIEAVAESPVLAGKATPNPTRALRVSTLFQLSALTRCNLLKSAAKLRILSFAGTPQNEDRLRDLHFASTGRIMAHPNPKVKLKLYERVVNVGSLVTLDFMSSSILESLGKRLPSSPWVEGD